MNPFRLGRKVIPRVNPHMTGDALGRLAPSARRLVDEAMGKGAVTAHSAARPVNPVRAPVRQPMTPRAKYARADRARRGGGAARHIAGRKAGHQVTASAPSLARSPTPRGSYHSSVYGPRKPPGFRPPPPPRGNGRRKAIYAGVGLGGAGAVAFGVTQSRSGRAVSPSGYDQSRGNRMY